ncbi:hypothetical protein NE237_022934 [Protea cynaroides]|uniref:HVA22-like protein n=1 Tax=Protea cynaroides TaxID=273540 RepID=A0A9Q0HE50_9MAGN|nr:hypothetical protein NE237_022934 [Protea cynaroides]
MALLGSAISSEVGLRLLLCPLGSNVVIRTACCSVGVVLPVYATFKAIEAKDHYEQQRWLLYWAVYGSFSLAEVFADKILSWVPMYYHMKFAFLVWLQLPSAEGARQMYVNYLRPFLRQHQARLDQILGLTYGEMTKFISAHQSEIQFGREVIVKLLASVNGMLMAIVHPLKKPGGHRAIEGPTRETEDSDTDIED